MKELSYYWPHSSLWSVGPFPPHASLSKESQRAASGLERLNIFSNEIQEDLSSITFTFGENNYE